MAKTILNFHFDFWHTSLTKTVKIRWNWRCKIFSLKIRQCKILDKFYVCAGTLIAVWWHAFYLKDPLGWLLWQWRDWSDSSSFQLRWSHFILFQALKPIDQIDQFWLLNYNKTQFKNGFWFCSPYQKWVEKEEFDFLGLSGQISNFLTLF